MHSSQTHILQRGVAAVRDLINQAWRYLRVSLHWLLLILPMAMIVGSAVAFFLWSLDRVTWLRFQNPWLLFYLPVAGFAVGLIYHYFGRSAEGGNNLIMDRIHQPGGGVPRRMAPLILFGTLVTHLFGGSAGREGTAIQMGGSIASAFGRWLRCDSDQVRIVLMAGIAAGFGAVFGTPLAGAVFALEVLMIGRIQYEALIPCFIAAIVGDWTCHAWGIHHTQYTIGFAPVGGSAGSYFQLDPWLLGKVILASAAFGLAGTFFAELSHKLSAVFKKWIPYAPLRPAVGGVLVIGLFYWSGTADYLGLGVWSLDPKAITIPSFFTSPEIHPWSWLWKIVFTAITLSAGFKGGEVTPLFFIGAALGNALAGLLGAPPDLFAGLGFVAIFAGATNTPLACTLMGIELFGATHGVYLATACFLAYLFSGHSSIYLSQRIAVPKMGQAFLPPETTMRQVREMRTPAFDDFTATLSTIDSPKNTMPTHKVIPRELGLIRIYLKPSDKRAQPGIRGFLAARPLYRELVDAAKRDGIMNAHAHHTHYGYSRHGKIRGNDPEMGNPELTMCIELIGEKTQLEHFCATHGELLQDKVIIYKHIEHWDLHGTQVEPRDALPEELESDSL
ncbi:MAG: DUF190 domain-containing protein [Chthoniobacterales bacterium]